MDQEKYEWIKKVRKMRDAIRAKRKSGDKSYLAKKIALWNRKMDMKSGASGKKFDLRKQSKINREHNRWNRKSAKWDSKGAKWTGKWEYRAARFNARMTKGV
ncbi:MAG: hypothetical protein QMC80_08600 [Thermoplasmatales archaeon]|nr:hypothetical protein [Thermoplasmatales archaeon]